MNFLFLKKKKRIYTDYQHDQCNTKCENYGKKSQFFGNIVVFANS